MRFIAVTIMVGGLFVAVAAPMTAAADPPSVKEKDAVQEVAKQRRDDPQRCVDSDDPQEKYEACDRLLAIASAPPQARAAALVERALAQTQMESYGAALADYDQAIGLDATSVRAHYLRGILNRYLDRHGPARADFERVISLLQAAPPSGDPAQREAFIAELREYSTEMQLDGEMEAHWANYLAEIQSQGDYRNWPGPPRDLYNQRVNAPISQARPNVRQRVRTLIGTFTFRCRNQTVMRITFDPDDRSATVRQFGRPPVSLRQASAPLGFRYAREGAYDLSGTPAEVRWRIGSGDALVCDRGLW
ncbi:MAG: hypothetical protein AB7H66_04400 [Hyphomonadaceae bacterium]